MSKIYRLEQGSFGEGGQVDEKAKYLEKPAMLVYVGKFDSMDGEVDITPDDISKLAENHNSLLSRLSRMAGGSIPLKHNPPIQLDHSTSARDTVGRLVGNLSVGEHTNELGNKVPALLGTARILGADNIEKVQDGRWTHLSGGFDLENHKITELTITPFPAAADASLLSRFAKPSYGKSVYVKQTSWGRVEIIDDSKGSGEFHVYAFKSEDGEWIKYDDQPTVVKAIGVAEKLAQVPVERLSRFAVKRRVRSGNIRGNRVEIYEVLEPYTDNKYFYETIVDGQQEFEDTKFKSVDDAWTSIKEFIEIHDDDTKGKKFSKKVEEDEMPGYKELKEKMSMYEKCKKHLMESEKLSDEGAEEKLAALGDEDLKKMSADHDEKEKKMAAEKEEAEKKLAAESEEKKEAELKRMSAMKDSKAKLVQLSKGIKETGAKVQLAAKKSKISARLSNLSAQQKVTPAEIKALKLDEMATKSDEVVEAMLSSYEKREPVIDVGLYGSTKALTGAQLSSRLKKMRMEKEELQTRLNMPSKRDAALKRLAELGEEEKSLGSQEVTQQQTEQMSADHEKVYGELKQLMAEGKEDEAKEHLKKHMSVAPAQPTAMAEHPDKEISSLAEEVKKMQTNFEEVIRLAAPAFGATVEELS